MPQGNDRPATAFKEALEYFGKYCERKKLGITKGFNELSNCFKSDPTAEQLETAAKAFPTGIGELGIVLERIALFSKEIGENPSSSLQRIGLLVEVMPDETGFANFLKGVASANLSSIEGLYEQCTEQNKAILGAAAEAWAQKGAGRRQGTPD